MRLEVLARVLVVALRAAWRALVAPDVAQVSPRAPTQRRADDEDDDEPMTNPRAASARRVTATRDEELAPFRWGAGPVLPTPHNVTAARRPQKR